MLKWKKKSLKKYLKKKKKKTFKLDFDRFPQSIYSQINRNVISNLKLKESRPEKASIK